MSLKSFQYREALTKALQGGQSNPEVVLALFEELIERGALEVALAKRSESDFEALLTFIKWKLGDLRYQPLLVEITRVLLDMYSGPLVLHTESPFLKEIGQLVESEAKINSELKQIGGQMDMMLRMASAL